MSPRARAWFGASLVGLGVTLMGAAMFMADPKAKGGGTSSLFLIGLAFFVPGVALAIWAVVGVVKEIGGMQSQFEIRLRSELSEKREPPRKP